MKKKHSGGLGSAVLLVLAMALLVFSGVQTSRATLTYFSEDYIGQVEMEHIGIALVENGETVARTTRGDYDEYANIQSVEETKYSNGSLLTGIDAKDFLPGKVFKEELCVRNTGEIDEFVRVAVRCYWEFPTTGKRVELSPDDIHLTYTNSWIKDTKASTKECTILYYPLKLAANEQSAPFTTQLRVDGDWFNEMTTRYLGVDEEGYKVYENTFDYNGIRFVLDVEADGVQTHNAATAISSAWGVQMNVTNDANGNGTQIALR